MSYEEIRSQFKHPSNRSRRADAKLTALQAYVALRRQGHPPYQAMTMVHVDTYAQGEYFTAIAAEQYARMIAVRAMYRHNDAWRTRS